MKRLVWSLAAVLVVTVSVLAAFFVASGSARRSHAQDGAATPPAAAAPTPTTAPAPTAASAAPQAAPAAPANPALPPPPSADLPPPLDESMPTLPPPAAELPPPPGTDTNVAPVAGGVLDASQDPGLKTINPEGYVYDPSGRRDPFFPPKILIPQAAPPPKAAATPGESPDSNAQLGNGDPFLSYYLKDYKLVGILWEVMDPKAIVRTPDNHVLTLHLKMRLGRENAVIAAIREKEVILIEPDGKGDYKKGEIHAIRMKN